MFVTAVAVAAGGCGDAEDIHHHPQRPEHGVRDHGAAAARDSPVGDAAGAPARCMQLQCAVVVACWNAVVIMDESSVRRSHSHRQLGYEPLEIIQAKSMEEVHEIKKKL